MIVCWVPYYGRERASRTVEWRNRGGQRIKGPMDREQVIQDQHHEVPSSGTGGVQVAYEPANKL